MEEMDPRGLSYINEWSKKYKIDISHLTRAKKLKFGPDASLKDEDALRDAWYKHEEISK